MSKLISLEVRAYPTCLQFCFCSDSSTQPGVDFALAETLAAPNVANNLDAQYFPTNQLACCNFAFGRAF